MEICFIFTVTGLASFVLVVQNMLTGHLPSQWKSFPDHTTGKIYWMKSPVIFDNLWPLWDLSRQGCVQFLVFASDWVDIVFAILTGVLCCSVFAKRFDIIIFMMLIFSHCKRDLSREVTEKAA